jgi:hypothetical protein
MPLCPTGEHPQAAKDAEGNYDDEVHWELTSSDRDTVEIGGAASTERATGQRRYPSHEVTSFYTGIVPPANARMMPGVRQAPQPPMMHPSDRPSPAKGQRTRLAFFCSYESSSNVRNIPLSSAGIRKYTISSYDLVLEYPKQLDHIRTMKTSSVKIPTTLALSPEVRETLDMFAAKQERSRSWVATQALNDYIRRAGDCTTQSPTPEIATCR